jgi:predicted nucleic acid-binding protein
MNPDINVLVAAARADHVHHRVASAWLDDAIAACAFLTRVSSYGVSPNPRASSATWGNCS